MVRMILVEDEAIEREGLRDLVDWPSLGVSLVADFEAAEDALAYAQDHPVDLLLTDIRLIEMDGLTLAKALRQLRPALKVIITSVLQDFESARTAISLQAYGYLPKPVEMDQLREVVEKAVHDFNRENQSMAEQAAIREQLALTLPLVRERYIVDVLTGGLSPDTLTPESFHSQLASQDMAPCPFPCRAVALWLDPEEDPADASQLRLIPEAGARSRGMLLRTALTEAAKAAPGAGADLSALFWAEVGANCFGCFLPAAGEGVACDSADDSQLQGAQLAALELIRTKVETACGRACTMGVGLPVRLPEELATSWQQAVQAIRTRALKPAGRVAVYREEMREGHARKIVEEIRAIVDRRFHENLTVQDVSRDVFLSPNYISILFKKEMGVSFTDYLVACRLRQAAQLLRDPKKRIYQVANEVGYTNVSHFCTIFKGSYGMSPAQYREAL